MTWYQQYMEQWTKLTKPPELKRKLKMKTYNLCQGTHKLWLSNNISIVLMSKDYFYSLKAVYFLKCFCYHKGVSDKVSM